MAKKKRNKGKRHKNSGSNGGARSWSKGSSARNRNWARCTHFEVATGKQCCEMVHIKVRERALCEKHRRRHSSHGKTKALIHHYQDPPKGSG